MDRGKRRDIIEIVGVVAIVASLIFLALEVRQSNLVSRIAARDSATQGHLDFLGTMIDPSVLAVAYAKVLANDELTPLESSQLGLHYQRRWRHYERVWYLYSYGALTDDEWEGFRQVIWMSMNEDRPFFKSIQESWQFDKRFLSREFADYVEAQLDQPK